MKRIFLSIAILALISCKKCKECFLIEEIDGNKTETSIGEYCGDEIQEKEKEQLYCVMGICHYECR